MGLNSPEPEDAVWAYETFLSAEVSIRRAVEDALDVAEVLGLAAGAGSVSAQHALGMYLRESAETGSDLSDSSQWLQRASEAGYAAAMVDYGTALAHGIGVARDPQLALIWLRRADDLLEPRADAALRVVLAMTDQG